MHVVAGSSFAFYRDRWAMVSVIRLPKLQFLPCNQGGINKRLHFVKAEV